MLPIQCRLARTALGLGFREAAKLAAVSPNTFVRLERGEVMRAATVEGLRAAFEQAGVVFIEADEEAGPGVRLKDREAR